MRSGDGFEFRQKKSPTDILFNYIVEIDKLNYCINKEMERKGGQQRGVEGKNTNFRALIRFGTFRVC